MARLICLQFAFLVVVATQSKAQESEFQQEVLKFFNETNQKLNLLNQFQNQLEDIQTTLRCVRASSAKLTLLPNGKMYSFQLANKNWTSANETCVKQGLQLAAIKDEHDLKEVLEGGKKVSQYTESWWVSGFASEGGRDFRYHDGTKVDLNNSDLWKDTEDEKGDCVRVYYRFSSYYANSYHDGKLYSNKCSKSWKYICELPRECY